MIANEATNFELTTKPSTLVSSESSESSQYDSQQHPPANAHDSRMSERPETSTEPASPETPDSSESSEIPKDKYLPKNETDSSDYPEPTNVQDSSEMSLTPDSSEPLKSTEMPKYNTGQIPTSISGSEKISASTESTSESPGMPKYKREQMPKYSTDSQLHYNPEATNGYESSERSLTPNVSSGSTEHPQSSKSRKGKKGYRSIKTSNTNSNKGPKVNRDQSNRSLKTIKPASNVTPGIKKNDYRSIKTSNTNSNKEPKANRSLKTAKPASNVTPGTNTISLFCHHRDSFSL